MIELLALSLAGLTDVTEVEARRARLQELRGRLGEAMPVGGGDFRARVTWVLSKLSTADAQWTLLRALMHLEPSYEAIFLSAWAEARKTVLAEMFDEKGHERWSRYHSAEDAGFLVKYYVHAPVYPPASFLPPPGMHSDVESLLPWMLREMRRDQCFKALLSPPVIGRLLEGVVIHDLLDWAGAVRPDLMRFTLDEALAANLAWHAQFSVHEGPVLHGVVVARTSDGGTIERLVTKAQLESEGKAMGHCIGGSYDPKAGPYFSWRDASGAPRETLEILVWRKENVLVEQHMGPSNASPGDTSPLAAFIAQAQHMTKDTFVSTMVLSALVTDLDALRARMHGPLDHLRTALAYMDREEALAGPSPYGPAALEVRKAIENVRWAVFQDRPEFRYPAGSGAPDEHSFILYGAPLLPTLFRKPLLTGSAWGFVGSALALGTDPLEIWIRLGNIVDAKARAKEEAKLRTRFSSFLAQATSVTFTLAEAGLPWKDFVTLALARGAWPKGQRVPRS